MTEYDGFPVGTECIDCGLEHMLHEPALTDEETGEKLEIEEVTDCTRCGGKLVKQ